MKGERKKPGGGEGLVHDASPKGSNTFWPLQALSACGADIIADKCTLNKAKIKGGKYAALVRSTSASQLHALEMRLRLKVCLQMPWIVEVNYLP